MNTKFLFYILKGASEKLRKFSSGSTFEAITKKDVEDFNIPVPSIEIQKQIVDELEGYRQIIDGAQKVINNYKPQFKQKNDWEMIALEELCTIEAGGTPKTDIEEYWKNGNIPWLSSSDCKNDVILSAEKHITESGLKQSSAKLLKAKSTLIALVGMGTAGRVGFLTFNATTNQNVAGLYPLNVKKLDEKYLFYASMALYNEFSELCNGSYRMANKSFVKSRRIPLPPLEEQKQIVAQLEKEQTLINSNRQLVDIFTKKTNDRFNEIWGE